MSTCLFANRANSTLAGAITNVALTANLASGSGVLFPAPGANQFFCMTFSDAATGLLNEIVHVTNVTGDTITMIRAQEGTTAQAWSAGDFASNLFTAGNAEFFAQPGQLQQQAGNAATDTGSANAMVATLSTVPDSLAALTGADLKITKSGTANTGAVTLAVNGFAATSVVHADGTALAAGEWPANGLMTVVLNAAGSFVLQSVGSSGSVSQSQLQLQGGNQAADTGTANALVVTLSPVPASLASLIRVPIRITKSTAANTGSATLAVNGLTVTPIVHPDGSALQAGDLPASGTFEVLYDGTNFVLQTVGFEPVSVTALQAQAGNYAADSGSAANIYACTLSPALGTAVTGLPIRIKIAHTNTGASTFNPGPGAVAIRSAAGAALNGGELQAGAIVEFKFDGTFYQYSVAVQAATTAQTKTGGSTTQFVTPAGLNALSYQSTQQGVPTGGEIGPLSHGLGQAPSAFGCYIVFTGAEGGYSIGDTLSVSFAGNSGESRGIAAWASATQIGAAVGTTAIDLPRKDTGATFNPASSGGSYSNIVVIFWARY
jgi:hypothetical protein